MADRYHRAAQDGYLEVLRDATKKDCNLRDEDGMTPTLWAAFEGNLDALRLLVGRGGDPEKSDNYGNRALHLASARGHMSCVTFLVSFGVNMWSQDIDQHTPQELAAMNDCHDILRYLDVVASTQETEDLKKVKKMKSQAEKEAQELIKNFKKVQQKADTQSKRKEKDLEQEKKKMEYTDDGSKNGGGFDLRRDSVAVHASNLKFSDMVGMQGSKGTATPRSKKMIGTVFKRAQIQKARVQSDTFKVRELEDGKQTVRNLSGLRRDSEVMYVARPDQPDGNDDLLQVPTSLPMIRRDTFGIFDRPGFGSVSFRRDSMMAMQSAADSTGDREDSPDESDNSVGGHQNGNGNVQGDISDTQAGFGGAIDMFLAGLGLQTYISVFRRQKIDLESLMDLTGEDLMEMRIELGPRKKILKAIEERKRDMGEDDAIEDSRL